MSMPTHPLDQLALVYVLIGLVITAWLGSKDWGKFRATRNDGPILTAWTAVVGAVVATLCWPIYLAVRVALWSLQHPRFVQWNNRKIAERVAASASVRQEEDWFIAQATSVEVASQGRTEEEARANLREAVELHFTETEEPPR
jgi:predicted RNase H-like HicB family nuclease